MKRTYYEMQKPSISESRITSNLDKKPTDNSNRKSYSSNALSFNFNHNLHMFGESLSSLHHNLNQRKRKDGMFGSVFEAIEFYESQLSKENEIAIFTDIADDIYNISFDEDYPCTNADDSDDCEDDEDIDNNDDNINKTNKSTNNNDYSDSDETEDEQDVDLQPNINDKLFINPRKRHKSNDYMTKYQTNTVEIQPKRNNTVIGKKRCFSQMKYEQL
mmetsp:Transcript_35641/g.31449  ORF Transcript_35641/g.31449 Transcript_35641/m.31449 type:complete len:217 (-) Transcript_35641:62-712(-)|eukprot:CAMPEP_0201570872 /NCGR_PEP_ID=MMETSP0190_2-20130828/13319_1 /ASSEMBLY_ACC=CAM_ASM_000263 /TAXON_ID=37353 /ORGANISM="Rosalina sp." /LENGTH=216 /DNA_ID=CAMNT_0047994875 /DNA_START=113 /DNA_END=763 /DNA_ORIENTATION=-